jgi:hypothetical protein
MIDEGDGSLSIVCTMLDHDGPVVDSGATSDGSWSGVQMAGLHRELAANVPWVGFDSLLAGSPRDRNVVLRLRTPFPFPFRSRTLS